LRSSSGALSRGSVAHATDPLNSANEQENARRDLNETEVEYQGEDEEHDGRGGPDTRVESYEHFDLLPSVGGFTLWK
jgi:hypothetical protein